ncbi:hypothetical protein I7I50_07287 [Histoplasma capsulatum G186AR]|uniref:Uncharacterized protein n=1 Tax=Ajellomyces capsulatus TaxID=5037 RepID=A0A8H8D3C2_AJECA|nr:hypothetical protein I7I52_09641 [Histoplasma capsulatum]QSS68022.1 hypothetical protein I7I50_07287 [Histoplasma capsulatum G186AR]
MIVGGFKGGWGLVGLAQHTPQCTGVPPFPSDFPLLSRVISFLPSHSSALAPNLVLLPVFSAGIRDPPHV